jgi:hypothetical protein
MHLKVGRGTDRALGSALAGGEMRVLITVLVSGLINPIQQFTSVCRGRDYGVFVILGP